MKKSDLVVMQEMASKDLDIRSAHTIIEAKKIKGGVSISFGVDEGTGQMIIREMATNQVEHYCVMYIVNKKQFDEIKDKDEKQIDGSQEFSDRLINQPIKQDGNNNK